MESNPKRIFDSFERFEEFMQPLLQFLESKRAMPHEPNENAGINLKYLNQEEYQLVMFYESLMATVFFPIDDVVTNVIETFIDDCDCGRNEYAHETGMLTLQDVWKELIETKHYSERHKELDNEIKRRIVKMWENDEKS